MKPSVAARSPLLGGEPAGAGPGDIDPSGHDALWPSKVPSIGAIKLSSAGTVSRNSPLSAQSPADLDSGNRAAASRLLERYLSVHLQGS